MSAKLLYRIASVLFFLFAVSHTFGVLSTAPSPEVAAVRSAMDDVHWQFMGSRISYGGVYIGFGLFVTAALLMAGLIAWHLGELAQASPQAIGMMGWVLFAFSIAESGVGLGLLLCRSDHHFSPNRSLLRVGHFPCSYV